MRVTLELDALFPMLVIILAFVFLLGVLYGEWNIRRAFKAKPRKVASEESSREEVHQFADLGADADCPQIFQRKPSMESSRQPVS